MFLFLAKQLYTFYFFSKLDIMIYINERIETMSKKDINDNYIWKDRKRNWCGLPWTFTVYRLYDSKLVIDTGFLNKTQDDVRLYRIMDVTLTRSIFQRIFGLGTIKCDSCDKSMGDFCIKNIKNSEEVKNQLSDLIEQNRAQNNVRSKEFLIDDDED